MLIDDKRIMDFFEEDNIISEKANLVFDNFINNVKMESQIRSTNQEVKADNVVDFQERQKETKSRKFYRLRAMLSVAASFAIIFVGLNTYAHTKGYENIFFLIKDMTNTIALNSKEEIFTDRDIVISYRYFQLTNDTEMQINEFQAEDNKAKLYLLIKENEPNGDAPFSYKVYNEKDELMYDGKSQKEDNQKVYTEVLYLSNYNDNVGVLKLEVYNAKNQLLKTVSIDLEEKVIEARTENIELEKISQIELNKFLKTETEKLYSEEENREIIVVGIYDIYYVDSKFVAKYLFIMPTEEDFEENKVEDCDVYSNTVEFNVENNEYKLLEISNPEIF